MTWEHGGVRPEMGNRYDWIDLYTRRYVCSDTFRELSEQQNALLIQFAQQGSERLSEMRELLQECPQADDTEDFLVFLGQHAERLRVEQDEVQVQPFKFELAMHELEGRATDNARLYGEIENDLRARYRSIGDAYELGRETPPDHVTRAIGHPSPGVAGMWSHVCGAIEAFRFATGETRDTVTLGIGLGEAWSQDALSHVVNDIHHLQLLQIALSSNPRTTAKLFNRSEMLHKLGMPPTMSENLNWSEGGWLHNALQYLKAREPQHAGLQIDAQT